MMLKKCYVNEFHNSLPRIMSNYMYMHVYVQGIFYNYLTKSYMEHLYLIHNKNPEIIL